MLILIIIIWLQITTTTNQPTTSIHHGSRREPDAVPQYLAKVELGWGIGHVLLIPVDEGDQ